MLIINRRSIMNLFKDLFKKRVSKNDERVLYVITEKLKPWIVLNCLEKENYIITDRRAEEIAVIILKQAISLDVLSKVINKVKII